MKLSSVVVGDSNDDNNFRHKLLLFKTQVPKLLKAFKNDSSAIIKLSKTYLHKIRQSKGFLMKNVPKPFPKSVLISLGLTAAASATDATTHKKIVWIRYNYAYDLK